MCVCENNYKIDLLNYDKNIQISYLFLGPLFNLCFQKFVNFTKMSTFISIQLCTVIVFLWPSQWEILLQSWYSPGITKDLSVFKESVLASIKLYIMYLLSISLIYILIIFIFILLLPLGLILFLCLDPWWLITFGPNICIEGFHFSF